MFINNKYTRWYNQIITHRVKNLYNGYTEKHHIIPKSLGGNNNVSNIVHLSAREHFVCHKLLTKMVQGQLKYKMLEAVAVFSNNKNRKLSFNSRDIAIIREANAIASSKRNKGNQYWLHRMPDTDEQRLTKSNNAKNSKWVNNGTLERFTQDYEYWISQNYTYGRLPFSEKTLESMRAIPGKPMSEETKEKIRASKLGQKKTAEHIQKLRDSLKKQTKYSCEYCHKIMTRANLSRWHGSNCKFALSNQ